MTPTEQDKEQRYHLASCEMYETLRGIFPNDRRLTGKSCSCGLKELITADRKRVELETLLDVKSNSEEAYVGEDWWSDDNVMDNSAYEIPRLYLDDRIAELKAQQDEV